MIPQPYKRIVEKNSRFLTVISDKNLSKFFEDCFNDHMSELGLYACWVCVKCMEQKNLVSGYGERPPICPKCGKPSAYMVGTFQAWASKTGDIFEWAFYHLMVDLMNVNLVKSPPATETHDFGVPGIIGIEAKGSATYVKNPDGTIYQLGRAGMLRSDTKKKAFSNAKEFKRKKVGSYFYIATNAMPDELVDYEDRDIDGIFDVTKEKQLMKFVSLLKAKRANALS